MAKFVINPKSSSQKDVPLNSAVSIGRDPSNDLVLSDSMVSRRHAMLERRDETYHLRDNNSSNGTFVNGDRLAGEVALHDGDLVAIGSSKLLFHLGERASSPASLGETGGVAPTTGLDRGLLPPTAPLDIDVSPVGRCSTCSTAFTSGDRFCRKCGKQLSPTEESLPPPIPPSAEARPLTSRPVPPAGNRGARPAASSGEVEIIPTYIAPRPVAPRQRAAEPAGFGIRLVAYLVDGVILFIPFLLVNLAIGAVLLSAGPESPSEIGAAAVAMIVYGALAMMSAAYLVVFWALRGATPGKSLLGLEIRTEQGQSPLGLPTAMMRLLGYVVSGSLFGLGYLWIAFSDDKRGWHDRIAKTVVVRQG